MGFIHERRTRDSRLLSRYSIITFLRFFWVVVVIWCEFGVFFYSLSDCKWPDKELKQVSNRENWLGFVVTLLFKTGSSEKPTRVLLISDPQLLSPGTSWFRYGTSTRYLRKGWSVVTRLHPHAVVWLGDLLASGRYVNSADECVTPSLPSFYLYLGLSHSFTDTKTTWAISRGYFPLIHPYQITLFPEIPI